MNIKLFIKKIFPFILLAGLMLPGCTKNKKSRKSIFVSLDHNKTGISFSNKLKPTAEFNMFNYMYFYNGAGIGAGDFNNDGKIDLFFSSNQGENKLYLNKGGLTFTDITKEAEIPQDYGWSTGVSVIDINNDGLLDIYICKVGKYEVLKSSNQLLICKGINNNNIPVYENRAAQYGLDFSGFSTQAVFFDYDGDSDMDLFLLNHSVHQDGSFASRSNFLGTFNPLSGDRIYRNEGFISSGKDQSGDLKFRDVTAATGINSSAIGYGLGVVASDINLDGYPDLYIGNDFHENDYLYINKKNGTFNDESNQSLMHTSKFSMGVDIADVTNDAYPEIISMDMLPSDPYILKRSLGEDEYNIFFDKIAAGYNYQYSRNNLQYNRRNNMFSEAGLYAGVYATDWSWAPLWLDFDNDGLKDLFISNGIPKRLNDMDYVNFISNRTSRINFHVDEKNMALLNKFPEIKIPNNFFLNQGELKFADIADSIANDIPTYSNGAIYADLDNDGDLDIVVNNIDDPALVYENLTNKDNAYQPFVEINLRGPVQNRDAIGAKIVLFEKNGIHFYENFPVRGFQSSMLTPIHIGLADIKPDSVFLIWPDNSYQEINITDSIRFSVSYSKGLPLFDYERFKLNANKATNNTKDITNTTGIAFKHSENLFNEFNREPLIPHMVSTEGPALAVGDANGDGKDDFFIGSSKTFQSVLFIQQPDGKFSISEQEALRMDSMYEDVDAVWADINGDGFNDLVVASGGNEYYGSDMHLSPRVYLNNGNDAFHKKEDAFKNVFVTASCVRVSDFNSDGFPDLFIGGRAVPWEYGKPPRSYLLQNDGTGKFKDVSESVAKQLSNIGMVTDAQWVDMDKNGDKDLVICSEWGTIQAFLNDKGKFSRKVLTEKKGWWNFLLPVDIDNDNDLDLIAGNLGLNSRLRATTEQPVRMYYNDFDDNGKKEQVLTYFINGKETVFANKDDLQQQLPYIKKKYLYAGDFAKASIADLFDVDKLKKAQVLSADYFSNAILINEGNMSFRVQALPWEAQLSSLRDAEILELNNKRQVEIFLAGNYYSNNIQMGRYDADFGLLLKYQADGKFECEHIYGLNLKGQVRHMQKIAINRQSSYILARNNDSTMIINFSFK